MKVFYEDKSETLFIHLDKYEDIRITKEFMDSLVHNFVEKRYNLHLYSEGHSHIFSEIEGVFYSDFGRFDGAGDTTFYLGGFENIDCKNYKLFEDIPHRKEFIKEESDFFINHGLKIAETNDDGIVIKLLNV